MNEQLQIVLQLEGLDTDKGHVRLDALVEELGFLKRSLQTIDRLVDEQGHTAVYYRVVDAKHSSPLTITLEPVKIPSKKGKSLPSDKRVQLFHSRYFSELSEIRAGRPPSTDIDNKTLKLFHDLAKGRKGNFKTMRIQNHEASVMIDDQFEKNVDYFLKESPPSIGTMAGKLEAVNLHEEANTFWIYPSIGTNRVRCKFSSACKEQVRDLLGKVVEVSGKKFYRANSNFPHRVDVDQFCEITNNKEDHLIHLRGLTSQNANDRDSVELINSVRNEW